eukprot:CAMPEP_0116092334 /NCGR_PEP_ID=MMETSP0327-20121206/7990_1 /TAXON_ID=44447 /ORGANISM="Pseudo-nitzschia delicatissima, Strain B596" /LENGTH=369 /DNA_ID=CAMNT_0003583759 /DNA_START=67 /DNA_END=1176 /DNA_ORIENTATION=+
MEGYLKNLLDDFAESDSAEVRIIDDNFNCSISSMDLGKIGNSSRPSLRWADSFNSTDFEESLASDDYQDSDTSSCTQGMQTPATNNSKNGVQLSARMERHRRNRWSATTSSTKPRQRHSLSPGVLRNRKRHSSNTTKRLHNSLDLNADVPSLATKQNQRKPIKPRHSLSPGVLRNRKRHSSNTTKRLHNTLDLDVDDPSLAMKQNQRKPIKPIKPSRDYNDDRAFTGNGRISPPSLSADLFDINMTLSHRLVIDEAIAISTEGSTSTNPTKTKTNRSKTPTRQRKDCCKIESVCAPPSVPVRRRSIENGYDYTQDRKSQTPSLPVRKGSIDDSFDSPRSEGKPTLHIPSTIRDLPHHHNLDVNADSSPE